MKKIVFGTPESITPALFCKNFTYIETKINYHTNQIKFRCSARGCSLTLPLGAKEQIYGLGLQLKAFALRGKKLTLRPNADPVAATGDSHAPVPFFVSTAGYGIYVDTARQAEFYFGSSDLKGADGGIREAGDIAVSTEDLYAFRDLGSSNISIFIPAAQGVTLYVIEGGTITDIVAQYNMLSGGGCAVPEWGLSAVYRCYSRYSQEQVLRAAKRLREGGFAVGCIGLEPGWQSKAYPCSYVWNKELYPNPDFLLASLRRLGFHVNLWEHGFVHPDSPIYKELYLLMGNYTVWGGGVPDFSLKEARSIFAAYHKKLVAMGVDGFKLDECDGSDYTGSWSFPNMADFPSGMDGEQYHALFGVLYMQTILEALDGKPAFSEVRNAGALCAPYPFVLYSDLYDYTDFIRGCVTAGFGGLLWTPEVRDAASKEEFLKRLQIGVFSPQCLLNAWYCKEFPWETLCCEAETKALLALRETLKPLLMRAFEGYRRTGIPPVRALVSDYTDDTETYQLDDEYLFCDNLLVAPMPVGASSRRVYLPDGQWRDFYTKERIQSGWFSVETDLIPVYEKADGFGR
ncbi:MAG TPA: glycoside hydrolase [Candidatus Acetatifactor stercoripullorum]|uniref:Glycoside hydrolase n=1 Tax=Candidatus Acetatifactor stercoripullorum TaxID=2838414 RepID=A0A9D1R352_9FIRM|nr:TIM-barrel domain-containing protein [uncultured Acetatifactor sp.]HIW80826.1 glycoside hydrolase [Candidatus Acetatifactor stercoripullorum]